MEYLKLKKILVDYYNDYHDNNFDQIDYVLAEIKGQSICEIKFSNFSKKEIRLAKRVVIRHLKTKKPYQKIFKRAYFFGLTFYVNENVLTPRQDSEILVENILKTDFNSLLDICCGSGCLGLSVKRNKPSIECLLSDISSKAIRVSKKNAKRLGVDVEFKKSNMFDKIEGKFDVIVCNPPYIETKTIDLLEEDVKKFDPILALDGGEDGLKFYKILYEKLDQFLSDNGKCFLEIGHNQGFLKEIFSEKYCAELLNDYNDLNRLLILKKEKSNVR